MLGIAEFYLFDLIYEVLEKKTAVIETYSKMIRLGKCMSGLLNRCNCQRTNVSTQTTKEKFKDTKTVIRTTYNTMTQRKIRRRNNLQNVTQKSRY